MELTKKDLYKFRKEVLKYLESIGLNKDDLFDNFHMGIRYGLYSSSLSILLKQEIYDLYLYDMKEYRKSKRYIDNGFFCGDFDIRKDEDITEMIDHLNTFLHKYKPLILSRKLDQALTQKKTSGNESKKLKI